MILRIPEKGKALKKAQRWRYRIPEPESPRPRQPGILHSLKIKCGRMMIRMVGHYKVLGHERINGLLARGIKRAVESLAKEFPLHDVKLYWCIKTQKGSVTSGGKTYYVEKDS
jgi:hypothetical protein